MIKAQRIIKYCAIAFALFLVINIFGLIMNVIFSLSSILNNNDSDKLQINEELKNIDINEDIKKIELDIASSKIIIIKEGTKIKVETDNEYIKVKERNNKLTITEEKQNLFKINKNSELVIYLPENLLFDEVNIDSGAGTVDIDYLNTKELELSLGAGQVNIQNLNVSNEADIDGGAGEVIIQNSSINNLDLDMGVGKLTLNSSLTGNNEIDAGIGELNINLVGTSEDYKIRLNKGLGNATLNNEKMKNDTYYGKGTNIIDIDGGIGSIKINYSR